MNDKGLKRKFDVDKYVKMMELDKGSWDNFIRFDSKNKRVLEKPNKA